MVHLLCLQPLCLPVTMLTLHPHMPQIQSSSSRGETGAMATLLRQASLPAVRVFFLRGTIVMVRLCFDGIGAGIARALRPSCEPSFCMCVSERASEGESVSQGHRNKGRKTHVRISGTTIQHPTTTMSIAPSHSVIHSFAHSLNSTQLNSTRFFSTQDVSRCGRFNAKRYRSLSQFCFELCYHTYTEAWEGKTY